MKNKNKASFVIAGMVVLLAGLLLWAYGAYESYYANSYWVYYGGAGVLLVAIGVVVWALTDYSIERRL